MLGKFGSGLFPRVVCSRGQPALPSFLLLKVWLYAYALGITLSWRLEQRIYEDLGFAIWRAGRGRTTGR
jgi:hypothetical protein